MPIIAHQPAEASPCERISITSVCSIEFSPGPPAETGTPIRKTPVDRRISTTSAGSRRASVICGVHSRSSGTAARARSITSA